MREDLKQARIKKGLTQVELADQIGKTQSVVSRYESGESPIDIDTAPLLAKVLGLPVIKVLYPRNPTESAKAA